MLARSDSARNWVFTINNFTEVDERSVIELSERNDVIRLIAEHEFEGEMGNPHIQGYVSFSRKVNRNWLEFWLGGRAYIAQARGGWRQNWNYCSKENLVFACVNNVPGDESTLMSNGEIVSSKVTKAALDACQFMDAMQFEDNFPNVWFYHRDKVLKYMTDMALRRAVNWNGELQDKNIWLWGAPGIGKSKWATNQIDIRYQFKKNCNKWWDGYSLISHKAVIIEDYPCLPQGNLLVQYLKIWGDRYCFQGECKGSHQLVQPGRFFLIVTSNYPIENCFENIADIEAIQRRFKELHMTRDNETMINQLKMNIEILDQ